MAIATIRRAALVVALIVAACGSDKRTIDLATTHQTWEGAGTSLPAWDEEIRALVRTDAWQDLYLDDMGMTVLRIDLMPTPVDPNGRHSDTAVRFGDDFEKNVALFDYDRAPRAAIYGELAADLEARLAAKGTGLRVLASVWTPPHWQKTGALLNNNGEDSAGGRLRAGDDNLQQYARYMAAAVVAWERRFGVDIHALSIQNEPRFEMEYSSMAFTPAEYATALAAVVKELAARGVDTPVFGPEDIGYGMPGDRAMLDHQLAFVRATMNDPIAGPALTAIAVHGYGGDGIDSEGRAAPDNWTYYWTEIAGYGLPSWQTETGGGSPVWDDRGTFSADSRGGPLMLANVMFEGMTYGHVSMWCHWFFTNTRVDTDSLLGADLDTDNPKYAVAKQFLHFIRPGAVHVEVTPPSRDGVQVVAWHHPDADQLTVVLLNLRAQLVNVELDLPPRTTALARYETTKRARFAKGTAVDIATGHLAIELPAGSVTTLSDVP